MGLLLLLTSTLLSSYFHPWRVVNAQMFIKDITLSIEPSNEVTRNTNVTLRCKATVSSSGLKALRREYSIYKDNNKVYGKVSHTSEDLLYTLSEARVINTGKYKCEISIEGDRKTSDDRKLTVTGLSNPVLHLNKGVVSEGEEITVWCTAPGESGEIYFYFYEDSKEIHEKQVTSNQAEAKLRLRNAGIHRIHCAYIVLLKTNSFKSEESNNETVTVEELPITAVLEILPQSNIYEGDELIISCTVRNTQNTSKSIHLYLSQGNKLLGTGNTTGVNHSSIALAKDPGEFECRLKTRYLEKVDLKTISVTELFSVPTLTMSPAEVFQKELMKLTCKSELSDKLEREELIYTLDPPGIHQQISKGSGIFSGKALLLDFNYTCVAQARGIVKHSETLTVRPKVPVSTPKISVVGSAILGQSFKILCQSDNGSLPINYTLLRMYDPVNTTTVKEPFQQALFTVSITKPEDIRKYMCEAKNGKEGNDKDAPLSKRLDATVIVPLTQPILVVIPNPPEISEGDDLYLICGVKGTAPVTFKWYRVGTEQPLHNKTSFENNTAYQVHSLSKKHSGVYYCEADNHANNVVRSDPVTIEVRMALWKKVLIGGFCLLAVSVLVFASVLYFRSKRGKREAAAELSVKPSSPKSDDSLTVNLTHDTEVYNAATVRVDGATVSVWSERPPEEANDEESSMVSNEPDVEYTEVVHPRPVDPARVLLRKGTDTVYSELQNSPHGAADHHDYGSVEYAELNSEQPEINSYRLEVNNHQDLPVPVD